MSSTLVPAVMVYVPGLSVDAAPWFCTALVKSPVLEMRPLSYSAVAMDELLAPLSTTTVTWVPSAASLAFDEEQPPVMFTRKNSKPMMTAAATMTATTVGPLLLRGWMNVVSYVRN